MNYPVISESKRVEALELPDVSSGKRIRMVLDTDTYNEVDDQFAVVHALASNMEVEALYAAPFHNPRSSGPEDGMERSYEEIKRLLDRLKNPVAVPVLRGSRRYLTGAAAPQQSDAATDLVARARAEADTPLYVVAIGAITNVASAILSAPDIIERIRVVWLGGHALWWHSTDEFNLRQDIHASRVILDSGVPLVLIPCINVASHLLVTVPELEAFLRGSSEIADYLVDTVRGYHEEHFGWSKVIWDIAATSYLVNPGWHATELVPSPILTDRLTWSFDSSRHLIRMVRRINRDAVFTDVYNKIRSA